MTTHPFSRNDELFPRILNDRHSPFVLQRQEFVEMVAQGKAKAGDMVCSMAFSIARLQCFEGLPPICSELVQA